MRWEARYVELCLSCKTARETRVLSEEEETFIRRVRAEYPERTKELDAMVKEEAFRSVNPFA